jgi:hypothetical protein
MTESSATICRVCGSEKSPHNFCCQTCFARLPREMRAPFAIQKIRCLTWLRQHPLVPKANL